MSQYNYPTTALLSKAQHVRLKNYAASEGISVSKILRSYVDAICPRPSPGRKSGIKNYLYGQEQPVKSPTKAIKDIMDAIDPNQYEIGLIRKIHQP